MKLLLTCGGTAGHVYPAVALARVFQSRDPRCEVLFVGADGGMELELLEKEGYPAPKVTLDDSITDFYAFTKDSFKVENYQFHPFDFEIPMAI